MRSTAVVPQCFTWTEANHDTPGGLRAGKTGLCLGIVVLFAGNLGRGVDQSLEVLSDRAFNLVYELVLLQRLRFVLPLACPFLDLRLGTLGVGVECREELKDPLRVTLGQTGFFYTGSFVGLRMSRDVTRLDHELSWSGASIEVMFDCTEANFKFW